MRGIVLAGGSGNGLHPLTLGIPKHLLPVYDKPMVFYPIELLVSAGINDILVITTSAHQPLFKQTLGDGSMFGASFTYAIQDEPKGIADALRIGKDFIYADGVCLITGDTILTDADIAPLIQKASKAIKSSGSATIFVKRDPDENQYGKVVLNKIGKCETIVGTSETHFYSSIIGLYVFPKDAVEKVNLLSLSERGRYEITDLIQFYFSAKKLQILQLRNECGWWDTNTPENLVRLNSYIYASRNK